MESPEVEPFGYEYIRKPSSSITELDKPTVLKQNAEDSGKPDGEKGESGPGANISSGFGGLGLDGITGNVDSDGEGAVSEGNTGSMSGESAGLIAGGEARGGSNGRSAGAAEITDTGS
ncbi:hypothetical protein AgCh_032971 [Apium graveolens]